MYFIDRGDVTFFTHDAHGAETEFRTLGPGEFFGEVAVLNGGIRSANARAKSEVCAYELHKDQFREFLRLCPSATEVLLRELAHRLGTSGGMLRHMVVTGVSEAIDSKRTPLEHAVQQVVRGMGNVWFVLGNLLLCMVWVVLNVTQAIALDPAPFTYLGLGVGIEGLLVATLVLVKQNRDEVDHNLRTELILSRTRSTELELQHLRARVDELAVSLGSRR